MQSEGERHGRIEGLRLKRRSDDHQRNFLVEEGGAVLGHCLSWVIGGSGGRETGNSGGGVQKLALWRTLWRAIWP